MHTFSPEEQKELLFLLEKAIEEDGIDCTTTTLLPENRPLGGCIVACNACVLAGLPAVDLICSRYGLQADFFADDGAELSAETVVAEISGPVHALLEAERKLLNFLGKLSGIATLTKQYAAAFQPTPIYDTRKTTPGWRRLEKYAVRLGGGHNHRMGLSDQVLIKDNHLRALDKQSGTTQLAALIQRVAAELPGLKIEIEVENEEELHEAVAAGADIVMLDNWPVEDIDKAVQWIKSRKQDAIEIELSGGISLGRAGELACRGADRISVGALTHSAPQADFSFRC